MKPFLICAAAFLLASCGRGEATLDDERPASPAVAATHEAQRLTVSRELQEKWGIILGPVSRVTVASTIVLPGVISLNQARTAHISPLLGGKVISVDTDLGQRVRKGQVVLVIHAPAFAQAKTAFLQAHARLDLTRQELERARALLEVEAIEKQEYLRRQSAHQSASTEYAVAESNLHSYGLDQAQIDSLAQRYSQVSDDTRVDELADPYLRVVSPVDGRVVFRDVIVGEQVGPEKTLLTVSDLTALWALLDARETDLPFISTGSNVSIRCQVYPQRTFEGRVLVVSDLVDEKLRTIKVRVEVHNNDLALKPNMFIQGVIEHSGNGRQALAVPEEAIQRVAGEPAVFVLDGQDTFVLQPVEVGEQVGSSRTIAKGLVGSETVAVAGTFNLKAELLKNTLGAEP